MHDMHAISRDATHKYNLPLRVGARARIARMQLAL